jgi:hypothetical protein
MRPEMTNLTIAAALLLCASGARSEHHIEGPQSHVVCVGTLRPKPDGATPPIWHGKLTNLDEAGIKDALEIYLKNLKEAEIEERNHPGPC